MRPYTYDREKIEFRDLRRLLMGEIWLFAKMTVLLPLDEKLGRKHRKIREMAERSYAEYSTVSYQISNLLNPGPSSWW